MFTHPPYPPPNPGSGPYVLMAFALATHYYFSKVCKK